ncbi:hypothetical protein KEM52_004522, partial [Ascosphaera acerosa]
LLGVTFATHAGGGADDLAPLDGGGGGGGELPPDISFSEREQHLPLNYLYRLLRLQIAWAEKEGEELQHSAELIKRLREEAWSEKEELLDLVLEAEQQYRKDRAMTIPLR